MAVDVPRLKKDLARALRPLQEGQPLPLWLVERWVEKLQRLSDESPSSAYLFHAARLLEARARPVQLLEAVQQALSSLEHEFAAE